MNLPHSPVPSNGWDQSRYRNRGVLYGTQTYGTRTRSFQRHNMNERESFLHAIRVDPRDETVRGAFADWLDEHGEHPWAAIIRRTGPIIRHALAEQLTDAWGVWLPSTKEPYMVGYLSETGEISGDRADGALIFRNGFLAEISCPINAFTPERAKRMFSRYPITHVEFTDRQPHFSGSDYSWWIIHVDRFSVTENDDIPIHFAPEYAKCRIAWETRDMAASWLSQTTVNWARELVDLYPLYVPTPPMDKI